MSKLGEDMRARFLRRLEEEVEARFPDNAAIQADAHVFTEHGVAEAEALGLRRRSAIRRYLFLTAAVGAPISGQDWAAPVLTRDDLSPPAKLDALETRALFDPKVRA